MTCSEPRLGCVTVPSAGWYAVAIAESAFGACRVPRAYRVWCSLLGICVLKFKRALC